jgi:hypothetical protein
MGNCIDDDGRHVLEQKDLEEPPHQSIAAQVVSERRSLLGELSCTLLMKRRIGFTQASPAMDRPAACGR